MSYLEELTSAGGKVYEVGGTVRDRLLNRKVKDRDLLVTNLSINKLSELLKRHGRITFVGRSFGILKFSPNGEEDSVIDIAIPRKEISTGTGHRDFSVEFDPDIPVEIDLGRRDFTVNAMAFDIKNQIIIDPFNGKEDLKNMVLRHVFKEAFIEDPLRLLRAIQFSARFGLVIEPGTERAMKENANLIRTISGERIIEELKKLMTAEKPSLGFKMMAEMGLLKHLLPELNATIGIAQEKQTGDDVFMHTMRVLDATRSDPEIDNRGDLELMFAALLHDIGKSKAQRYLSEINRTVFYGHQIISARMAIKILNRLKCTIIGIDPSIVCKLIENHMFETKSFYSDKAIRRFVSKIGKELIFKLMDLRLADNRGGKYPKGGKGVAKLKKRITEEINRKVPFGPKDLAINGHDIMSLGVAEGPGIGKIISELVEIVLDDPELNTKEYLAEIVKKRVQGT